MKTFLLFVMLTFNGVGEPLRFEVPLPMPCHPGALLTVQAVDLRILVQFECFEGPTGATWRIAKQPKESNL